MDTDCDAKVDVGVNEVNDDEDGGVFSPSMPHHSFSKSRNICDSCMTLGENEDK